MNSPKPRRTAERILDVTLTLFNRFGEPNVSTSQLCGELGISPGNLFYHHASRDALVVALFHRYQTALEAALKSHAHHQAPEPDAPREVVLGDLVALCQALARCARDFRFMFRDLDDLVSRHRALEDRLPDLLRQQARALERALSPLCGPDLPAAHDALLGPLWSGYVLSCLTGCCGLDGALDPRERRSRNDDEAVALATCRAMAMLRPALDERGRQWLQTHLNEGARLGTDPWFLKTTGP